MTHARVVLGAALWARAGRMLASGWSRIEKSMKVLWHWVFPPVPLAIRRTLLRGLLWSHLLMPYFLLNIVSGILVLLLLPFLADSSTNLEITDPVNDKIVRAILIFPEIFFLWQGVRLYCTYRRFASWMRVNLHGQTYEVPRALALRSAFLVPAIMDYFQKHFTTEIVYKHLVRRRSLVGGSRFPWQETLVSPLTGRVYTLPRSWWRRLIQNSFGRFLWEVTRRMLYTVTFLSRNPEKEDKVTTWSKITTWFKKLLKKDEETIVETVAFIIALIIVIAFYALIFYLSSLLVNWVIDLLGNNGFLVLAALFVLLLGVFIMLHLHLKRDGLSNLRLTAYAELVTKLFPMDKPFLSIVSSIKKNGQRKKETNLTSQAEESEFETQVEMPSESLIDDKPEYEVDTDSPKEHEEIQKEDPSSEDKRITNLIKTLDCLFGEIMPRSILAAHYCRSGHKMLVDGDSLWAHGLGMGALWDVPSDKATLKRYQALPMQAKGMIDEILREVLKQFNNPLSEYTATTYPDVREKWIYGYLPDGKTPFRGRYPHKESFEIIDKDMLPPRSDYFMEEKGLTWQEKVPSAERMAQEVIILGWEEGYSLADYARLFRNSAEMKASFWAAYQMAWRLMRFVSEERDNAKYFGQPLTLPVRSEDVYMSVKGVEGFRVDLY